MTNYIFNYSHNSLIDMLKLWKTIQSFPTANYIAVAFMYTDLTQSFRQVTKAEIILCGSHQTITVMS